VLNNHDGGIQIVPRPLLAIRHHHDELVHSLNV
jgi:hypothetical protein